MSRNESLPHPTPDILAALAATAKNAQLIADLLKPGETRTVRLVIEEP